MRKKIPYLRLALVLIPALSLIALGVSGEFFKEKIFSSKASPACDYVTIQVSADGENFSSSIDLPSGVSTRYYIKVVNANEKPCSSNFDAYSHSCKGGDNDCTGWNTTLNWGTYKPNEKGILRADLDRSLA